MERRTFLKSTGLLGLATVVTPVGIFQTRSHTSTKDNLLSSFTNPAASAKPHTWWHWMNGNVTREGITLDLEAMARVGLGGFQNFDAGTGIPKGPVEYLSTEWLELKRHTISEAQRLGLEFTMHNCPGWSSSGGPWITPELSMQEVTFSELVVEGGKTIKTIMPRPFTRLETYKDVSVIACRIDEEICWRRSAESIRTNSQTVAIEKVTGEGNEFVKLIPDPSGAAFIEFEFREAVSFRQVSFITSAFGEHKGPIVLQVSDDGVNFLEVASFNTGSFFGEPRGPVVFTQTVSFRKAKYVRFSCNHEREFSQIRLSPIARPSDWDKRSNYSFNRYGVEELSEDIPSIPKKDIVDVSKFMRTDGTFQWQVPEGLWCVLRFGHTATGTLNRSAPDTGIGLECDKYSATAFEFHFNKMMEQLLPLLVPMGKEGKVGLLIDSYEVGMQNWTPGFEQSFHTKSGYELFSYLPALTGRVVENAETTDRFLWDLRRVQGDLMADNYYGKFTELCHKNNIISYIQPYDRGPMEEMQIGARVDINVGEFWNNLSSIFQNNWTMRRTVRLSASIAHTNGQDIVAAESFTGEPESSKWQEHPFALKMIGDRMFTEGLNRMIFHRYAHQPHPTARPGMTMGAWGSHFERTNTWWEQGKSWIKYLTRCQSLLQEGLFVADLAYFTGEDAGVYTRVERYELMPPPPYGIDYDLINAKVLLAKSQVINSKLVLRSGTTYSILVLQNYKTMSLEVLNRLKDLVAKGLTIVGDKPARTPGIAGHDNQKFISLVDELWGNGAIHPLDEFETLLKSKVGGEDFAYSSRSGRRSLRYIHRRVDEAEVYFVLNESRTFEQVICTFRVDKKQPEIWNPVTGETYEARIYKSENAFMQLVLDMDPLESVFVVFRKPMSSPGIVSIKSEGAMMSLEPYSSRVEVSSPAENFTISLWAKPENSIMLSTDNFMDGQEPWTDLYALYPSAGKALYGDGHATAGLAVGRNGVSVWENSTGKPTFRLSVAKPISGWTHIALSYENGVPEIYLSGERVKVGEKSPFTVHPASLSVSVEEGASFFNGDLREVEIFQEVLSPVSIAQRAKHSPSPPQMPSIVQNGDELVAFADGQYTITKSNGAVYRVNASTGSVDLSDDWTIQFPINSGAPPSVDLGRLTSLHLHENPGVRYFSGSCSYEKIFMMPRRIDAGRNRYFLDLGEVEVIAEVTLNGMQLRTLWTRPFILDVTKLLRRENTLTIKVTNLWPNRLIGDEQSAEPYKYAPGAGGSGFASLSGGAIQEIPEWYRKAEQKPDDGRVSFATWKHYTKDSPLLQSGLIGPVTIRIASLLVGRN